MSGPQMPVLRSFLPELHSIRTPTKVLSFCYPQKGAGTVIRQEAAEALAFGVAAQSSSSEGKKRGRVPQGRVSLDHKDSDMTEIPACRALS